MAHTGIFATAAQCAAFVGENVDTTGWVEANINTWCSCAESFINLYTRKNWSDLYAASINADLKSILTEAECCLVGIYGINYNQENYTYQIEAENMKRTLKMRFDECINLLKDIETQKFITANP